MTSEPRFPRDAACAGHPHLAWWDDAVAGEPRQERDWRHMAAIWVCDHKCPVREACLADVDPERDEGVRGGVVLPPLTRPIPLGYSDGYHQGHGKARKSA